MSKEVWRQERFRIYYPGEDRPTDFEGTNSETCRHNVIAANVVPLSPATDSLFDVVIFCTSCDTNLTGIWNTLGKNYEYDSNHGVWVHVPIKPTKPSGDDPRAGKEIPGLLGNSTRAECTCVGGPHGGYTCPNCKRKD